MFIYIYILVVISGAFLELFKNIKCPLFFQIGKALGADAEFANPEAVSQKLVDQFLVVEYQFVDVWFVKTIEPQIVFVADVQGLFFITVVGVMRVKMFSVKMLNVI